MRSVWLDGNVVIGFLILLKGGNPVLDPIADAP